MNFNFIRIFWIIVGLMIPYSLRFLTKFGLHESHYVLAIIVIVGAICLYLTFKGKHKVILENIISGITFFIAISIIRNLALTYIKIPEWDFLCFYLFGKVGISNSDFYNPQVFSYVFNDLGLQNQVSDDFKREIVDVGFWYPPPSMFLFLPLGLFDLKTSYIIWQTLVILFFILDILLLIKFFPPVKCNQKNSFIILLPLILVLLLFPDILMSVRFGQTVTLFLFFLLLMMKYINSWKSGLFLAILFVIKPLAIFFILYFIFTRKWKMIFAFFITGSVILIISVFFFGYTTLLNYFISAPASRIPAYVFYEPINQSLHAVLLRLKYNFFNYLSIQDVKIIYYVLAILLFAVTIFITCIKHKTEAIHSFILYIPATLLVYPATLSHYNILLLPIISFLFIKNPFHRNTLINFLLIICLYFIGFYSLFLFNLTLWIILVLWRLLPQYFKKIIDRITNVYLLKFGPKRISMT